MNPNNDNLNTDYLNQIAPKVNKKMIFSRKQLIIFGGLGIIVIIGAIIIINGLAGKVTPLEQLAARLTTTQSIMDESASKIKNTQLRTLNGSLKIYLTNTIRDIEPIIVKEKININKLSPTAISAESSAKILANLEEARLNAVYDRTYAREMSYKLDTTLALMRQIYNETKSESLKSFLKDADKNLQPVQKQFSDFNAANS